jgi:hypothetical protein
MNDPTKHREAEEEEVLRQNLPDSPFDMSDRRQQPAFPSAERERRWAVCRGIQTL